LARSVLAVRVALIVTGRLDVPSTSIALKLPAPAWPTTSLT